MTGDLEFRSSDSCCRHLQNGVVDRGVRRRWTTARSGAVRLDRHVPARRRRGRPLPHDRGVRAARSGSKVCSGHFRNTSMGLRRQPWIDESGGRDNGSIAGTEPCFDAGNLRTVLQWACNARAAERDDGRRTRNHNAYRQRGPCAHAVRSLRVRSRVSRERHGAERRPAVAVDGVVGAAHWRAADLTVIPGACPSSVCFSSRLP